MVEIQGGDAIVDQVEREANMETKAEALRCRIMLYRSYLKAGVHGTLAIKYLRQIAEDDEALNELPGSPWHVAADGLLTARCGGAYPRRLGFAVPQLLLAEADGAIE